MVNVEPPEDLPDHWHREFKSKYVSCISEKYSEFDEEQFRSQVGESAQKEREHRKLLNMCVFPFMNDFSPCGLKFVRGDPLEEMGLPNFDFLLWDFEGQAIFGEAKANINQGAQSLVNEVNEQIDAVEENQQYIEENYLGKPVSHQEYVIATFSSDAEEITDKVLSSGSEIVTWAVHQMRKEITVSTTFPTNLPSDEDMQAARWRILHSNHELNNALKRAKSAEGSLDVFPKSDSLSKLQVLLTASFNDSGYCFVNEDEVKRTVQRDLTYLPDSEIVEFADEIIELGISVDFLREYEQHSADYKIKSRYTSHDGLEKTLERKWINYRVRKKKENYQKYCEQYAMEQVGRQTQINDSEWV